MNPFDKVNAIINRARKADFGQVFEQTIENYKKIVVQASIAILLMMFVFLGVMVGITVAFMVSSNIPTDAAAIEQAMAEVPPYVNALFNITWAILLTPLTAGFMIMAHEAEKRQPVSFSMIFAYFRKPGLKHLLLSALLVALFTEAVGEGVMYLTSDPDALTPNPAVTLLLMVFNIAVGALTLFIIPLIVFEDLTAIQAIRASIGVARKSFFTIVLLLIVVGICAVLGIFAFCLGIIVTLPLIFSCRYILYRNMVGIDQAEDVDTIGLPETEF
jgi:hypothetical protein